MVEKMQYKLTFQYGLIFLMLGVIGLIFPESSQFIRLFCIIFGGSTFLKGFLYFKKHRANKDIKQDKA